jgi:AcrR family transcriptional regulator
VTLARKTLGVRRNLKEQQRREQIKQAAISAFSAKGYQAATLDDVVLEAGVSKSLFYWYWESKSALLSELIDGCLQPYVELLRRAADSNSPFDQKLSSLLTDFLELHRSSEKLDRLVHFCALHHSKKPGEQFGKQVDAHFEELLELLQALFVQGQRVGAVNQGLDPASLALCVLSFIEGYIFMSALAPRMPLDRLLRPLFGAVRRELYS